MPDRPGGATGGLADQVADFAAKLDGLVSSCLPNAPGIAVSEFAGRYVITPEGQTDEKRGGVPLAVHGEQLASLRFSFQCRMGATAQFLAVDKSKIWLVAAVDNTPIIRYEFLYEADWVPLSHIQVHGQRGALSHLLSKSGHKAPHDMATLHLPTGGARFRPNLEDVIQFLIADCQFDSLEGWREAVERERSEWREIQTRSVVRAMADAAAEQLEAMGYTVIPPPGGHPERGHRARFAW